MTFFYILACNCFSTNKWLPCLFWHVIAFPSNKWLSSLFWHVIACPTNKWCTHCPFFLPLLQAVGRDVEAPEGHPFEVLLGPTHGLVLPDEEQPEPVLVQQVVQGGGPHVVVLEGQLPRDVLVLAGRGGGGAAGDVVEGVGEIGKGGLGYLLGGIRGEYPSLSIVVLIL